MSPQTSHPEPRNHVVVGIVICILIFSAGLLPIDSVRPLQLLGWPVWIFLVTRLSLKSGLTASLLINLTLSLFGSFWIEYFGSGFLIKAVLLSFWVLPTLTLIFHGIRKITMLGNAFALVLASVFPVAFISQSPLYQGFFNFPLVAEQILFLFHGSLGLFILGVAWIGLCAGALELLKTKSKTALIITAVNSLVLILAFGFGAFRTMEETSNTSIDPNTVKKVALVQHNVPFFSDSRDLQAVLESYAIKSIESVKRDLIVFPLYDLPENLQRDLIDPDSGFFRDLALKTNSGILVATKLSGLVAFGKFSNNFVIAAALRSGAGSLDGVHRSSARSPFHDPRQVLEKYDVIKSNEFGTFGALISYELETPDRAQTAKRLGAKFLVGLSNPGDAPYSPLPAYQLKEIQRRAIETNLPILSVTPNGYSAHIDSRGRVVKKSQLGQSEILLADLVVI